MDTSEQYIKMCEKAEEIQKGHQWVYDDLFVSPKEYYRDKPLIWGRDKRFRDPPYTWLPRQDQLQEMIDQQQRDWVNVLEMFTLYAFYGDNTYTLGGTPVYYGMGIPHNVFSMEQLWLAFVMKEKFNKTWNGEAWQS